MANLYVRLEWEEAMPIQGKGLLGSKPPRQLEWPRTHIAVCGAILHIERTQLRCADCWQEVYQVKGTWFHSEPAKYPELRTIARNVEIGEPRKPKTAPAKYVTIDVPAL